MSTRKIKWQEWTPETLGLAGKADKPLLLAITATWCHWCHVMEQTTFGNDEVAEFINANYVPIRADNDRRPDLNSRYNMGGWPTVALLMPDGEVITGATYLPPRQMLDLLRRVYTVYTTERELLKERAEDARLREEHNSAASTGLLSENIRTGIVGVLEKAYDSRYGGFGIQPKFPQVPALKLLLADYRRTGNEDRLEMVKKTLDEMAAGGMHDQVEGGFFRYSTTRDWSVPHFEKMLEDNAGLMTAYSAAYSLTSENRYLDTIRDVVLYLESTLLDKESAAFLGSQDADEEYYQLSLAERRARTAPSVDRAIYVNWNGMIADAYLRAYESIGDRNYRDRALGVLDFVLNNLRRGTMYYHYFEGAPREPGFLSDQLWMGTALVRAYECTGDRRYIELAREAADTIIEEFAAPDGGFYDITVERQEAEKLIAREKSLEDNANAARFLNRLAYYAHHTAYRDASELALRSMVEVYDSYGTLAAAYALAVTDVLEEPLRIAISGPREDPRTQTLIDASLRYKAPSHVVEVLQTPEDELEMEELGLSGSELPQAAVCQGSNCRVAGDAAGLGIAIREVESGTK